MSPFVGLRTHITQGRVKTASVVETFYVFEHPQTHFGTTHGTMIIREFSLECAKEALHDSIVIAVTNITHADHHIIAGKHFLIQLARVLAPLIYTYPQ